MDEGDEENLLHRYVNIVASVVIKRRLYVKDGRSVSQVTGR